MVPGHYYRAGNFCLGNAMPYYKICSNPECDFSDILDPDEIAYVYDIDTDGEPSAEFVEIREFPDRNCTRCKTAMLLFCPHCRRGLFDRPDAVICTVCGRKVKSE